jgi:hypothetical protein
MERGYAWLQVDKMPMFPEVINKSFTHALHEVQFYYKFCVGV